MIVQHNLCCLTPGDNYLRKFMQRDKTILVAKSWNKLTAGAIKIKRASRLLTKFQPGRQVKLAAIQEGFLGSLTARKHEMKLISHKLFL